MGGGGPADVEQHFQVWAAIRSRPGERHRAQLHALYTSVCQPSNSER